MDGVQLGIAGLTDPVLVGTGGFAVVYRAEQPAFRRTVAVKVLSVGRLDEETRHRFERECQAMGSLSEHPSIVTVFDAGFTAEGRPYLLMAYMPGGSLEDRIRKSGALPWQEAVSIAVRMAGALEVAHRGGVVHRDVKPDNILLSSFGEPQLTDFGIARIAGGPETQSGVITASIVHAAPEVMEGNRPTVAADVYSLGSTLFTLLAGKPAFTRHTDETVFPLMHRIKSNPIPDLRERGVPGAVCEVVEAAMAKDPADRPTSALDMGRRLQEAQQAAGATPTSMLLGFGDASDAAPSVPAGRREGDAPTVVVAVAAAASPEQASLGASREAAAEPVSTEHAGETGAGELPGPRSRWRWAASALALVVVAAVLVGGVWILLRDGDGGEPDGPEPGIVVRGTLEPGMPVEGALAPGEVPTFTFEGREGVVAGVEMRDLSGGMDPFVRVFGPDGAQIAGDDDLGGGVEGLDALALFVMPSPGTYRVEATDGRDRGGDFVVALTLEPVPLLERPAGIEESLGFDELDRRVFVVRASAGEPIFVRMISEQPGLDPFLWLYGPVEMLTEDDDSGGGIEGLDAFIELVAPVDGSYRIVAGHFDNVGGPFRLEVSG